MNEKYAMNPIEASAESQMNSVFSWFATGVVAFLCTALGPASIRFVQPFAAMFRELGIELPWLTRFLFATYAWLLPAIFLALAVFVLVKEFAAREPRCKLFVTAKVFLAALVMLGLVILILYLPLLAVAGKLTESE